MFKLSDYNYELPQELIAQKPATPRDASRLLVFNRNDGSITHAVFREIGDFLHPKSRLVMNNSSVEKARILFENREIFVLRTIDPFRVEALVKPGRAFKEGKTISVTDNVTATTEAILEKGQRIISFSHPVDSPEIQALAHTPFPPYIKADESLAHRYQTVYAKDAGSKAAPTAGLHFTEELLQSLEDNGHPRSEVTLHVGLGTFAPVQTEDITDHKLHSEWFAVNETVANEISESEHVTAVGTTSVRVLESMSDADGKVKAGSGETDIFIYPGYTYKRVNSLITNFHLPKSSLLMLVSALIGYEETMEVYRIAVQEKYRFFSFGDAMLIV